MSSLQRYRRLNPLADQQARLLFHQSTRLYRSIQRLLCRGIVDSIFSEPLKHPQQFRVLVGDSINITEQQHSGTAMFSSEIFCKYLEFLKQHTEVRFTVITEVVATPPIFGGFTNIIYTEFMSLRHHQQICWTYQVSRVVVAMKYWALPTQVH